MTDAELARAIAEEAGVLLLRIQEEGADGARGDREANILILDRLRAARPEDAILSEESADDPIRLTHSRVWIIDPLDGTREFAENRADWAVHVALAVDGVAAAGAVALPRLGVTLGTDVPPVLAGGRVPPRMLVSRSRASALCSNVGEKIGAEHIAMGSAGAKAMAVVRGEAEIYLHTGGQHQWDNCAPVAVALAAGLHCSRIDGSEIIYNQPGTSLPDLLICRPEWSQTVLESVANCS
ncbi:MAG: 3'(2'),5'-bisphosphate nucleotidase CysQ [Pseudomonadota bacterium]